VLRRGRRRDYIREVRTGEVPSVITMSNPILQLLGDVEDAVILIRIDRPGVGDVWST